MKTLLWSISVFLPHFSENSWMRPPPGGGQRPGMWPRVLLVFPLDTATCRCAPPSPYLHSSSFPNRRLHHLGKWWRGNKGVPAGRSGKEEGRKEGRECLSRARGGRRAQKLKAVRARERLSSLLYRVSRCFCSPFLSTTRFFSIESSRDSQCLAAGFRIHRSSDLPTALRAWIMTYRLFFPFWGFGAAWGVAKACLVVRLSEGPHCLITGSVLLGTVAQLSRVAGTTWGKKSTRSPSLALARAPEAFWELGFLLFLSTGPLGAIDNKLGPLVFFFFFLARKAQKEDGCCCRLLAFQQDCMFISKYIRTARKHLLTRMRW